jgi:NAD(P)-dependent dehydrogenase (short-subunit alcohol dehydrogenase family)
MTKPIALVTGGGRGLGKHIAARLIADGFDVVIAGRDAQTLGDTATELGCRGAIRCDIADPEHVSGLTLGLERLDVLVNNAADFGPMESLQTADFEAWAQAVMVNLIGTARVIKECLPLLKRAPRAKIVNVSGGGIGDCQPALSAYAASKAGLLKLTEDLSVELAPTIDINAICPGPLATGFVDKAEAAGPHKLGADFYRSVIARKNQGPEGFDQAAELCAFLASRESDGITGRTLSARYDDWRNLRDAPDAYKIRRIDPFIVGRNACLST